MRPRELVLVRIQSNNFLVGGKHDFSLVDLERQLTAFVSDRRVGYEERDYCNRLLREFEEGEVRKLKLLKTEIEKRKRVHSKWLERNPR